MGELLYEWNQVAVAWDHLSRGLERAELGGDVRALIAGYLMAGRVTLTQGDVETAAEYLERARPLVEQAPFQIGSAASSASSLSSGSHRTGSGLPLIGPMRCCRAMHSRRGQNVRRLSWRWPAC